VTILAFFFICGISLSLAQESSAGGSGRVKNPKKHFVNSLGMKMIHVKAKAFDAWTSSLGRFISIRRKGGQSDVPFALNRPRVPMRVELTDYYLGEFSVTNKMYRDFVKATGHKAPSGKLVNFYWTKSSGAT
jgi:formylglycine-generating enzyme required for sulfatase activity